MSPVLCIGELLIDFIASDGSISLVDAEAFVARPGGAPANVAVALARLGVPSAFCGVVGNDPFGNRLRLSLSENGVDTANLRSTGDAATTIAFAWKNERGDGEFQLVRLADVLLDVEDVEAASIESAAAILVGSVSLAAEPSSYAIERAVEIARQEEIPVCVDVNIRPSMWYSGERARDLLAPVIDAATLVKLSVDDARYLFDTGDNLDMVFAELNKLTRPFTVLTDGARGAWFVNAIGEFEHVKPYSVEAVEPTGAGDAFTAAIISRLIGNGWLGLDADDVRFASAAGALTTTRTGAIDSLPSKEEVHSFLSTNQEM